MPAYRRGDFQGVARRGGGDLRESGPRWRASTAPSISAISPSEEVSASLDAAGDLEFVEREPIAPEPAAAALSPGAAAAKQDSLAMLEFSGRPV
jgi:hypothetical protein